MIIQFLNLVFFLFIISVVSSCNSNDGIPHPKIFKGLKLGLDIDSSNQILTDEICSNDLELADYTFYRSNNDRRPTIEELEQNNFRCQYKITDEIFAQPNIFYSNFKGKQIVSSATLLFHSPSSFPYIEAQIKNKVGVSMFEGLPAINYYQTNKLLEMFDIQYGNRIDNNSMSYYSWKAENLDVVMYVEKYDKWFFYINYLEPCDSVLTLDAYKVIVTYHYPDEIDKLLEYDKKTKFGEEVGDKI